MAELVHEWLSLQSLDFLYLSWLRNSAILDFVSYSLFEDVVIVIRTSLVSQNQSAKEALNCIRTHECDWSVLRSHQGSRFKANVGSRRLHLRYKGWIVAVSFHRNSIPITQESVQTSVQCVANHASDPTTTSVQIQAVYGVSDAQQAYTQLPWPYHLPQPPQS
jgi:hypothetical protein